MIRVLVPVFIVAIIAVVVLVIYRTDRRAKDYRRVCRELAEARQTITKIDREIDLQSQAKYTDLVQLSNIIDSYVASRETPVA